MPQDAEALVEDATAVLGLAVAPTSLRAMAQWPRYLELLAEDLRTSVGGKRWSSALIGIRRTAAEVLRGLPHPMDLQWDVLERKGLTEDRRVMIADALTAAAAAMPVNAMIAAAMWIGLGEPEIPAEF